MSTTVENRLRETIVNSLTQLAIARELLMGDIEILPMVEYVTHCASCGFSYHTYRHIATHRDKCSTPELHPVMGRIHD